jgi:hypothetical protein
MAAEALIFTKQRALYESRVAVDSDISDWQNYVLDMLRATTAMLVSLEPRKSVAKGPFSVIEMELVAKGTSYNEFADFVERLERGPRIVRLEKLRMERQQGTIYVTYIIKGLVKPSAKKPAAKPAAPKPPADGAADTPADVAADALLDEPLDEPLDGQADGETASDTNEQPVDVDDEQVDDG